VLQTIAIHDVRPEHVDAFRTFMGKVEAAVAGAPGLIEIASWREVRTGRLVAVARWESQAAFEAAAPAIMGLSGERDPAWTDAPDDLLVLVGA
jgi:hypothetical protein